MIKGINPLTISSIEVDPFRRFGSHPYYLRVMRKKNPIRAFFRLYEEDFFDWVKKPAVVIRGANGKPVERVVCKSNDEARLICKELNKELTLFLERHQR